MSSFIIEFRKTWIFILKIAIFMSIIFTFFAMWGIFYEDTLFYKKGNYLLIVLYTVLLFIFYRMYGANRVSTIKLSHMALSWILTLSTTNLLAYFILSLIDNRLIDLKGFVLLFILQVFVSIIYSTMLKRLYSLLYPVKDVILVYGDHMAPEDIVLKILTSKSKYRLISINSQYDDFKSITELIDKVDGVFLYCVQGNNADKLINYCYGASKRTYIIPTTTDIIIKNATVDQVSDIPVMVCKNRSLTLEQIIIKRIIDILLSTIGLVLLSPVMLIISIAIKSYDGGKVFFKQRRATRGDRVFTLYKFRSMIQDAEKDGKPRLASKNDSRITPIGKFIRSTRIDEIPQLINVFKGDMSIVGPRPERPEIISDYIRDHPEFAFRTKIKSGLTGYAQIYGKYNTAPKDKLHLDLMYIEQYSLLLDIKLIFLTIKTMLISESTEGIDPGQLTAMSHTNLKNQEQIQFSDSQGQE